MGWQILKVMEDRAEEEDRFNAEIVVKGEKNTTKKSSKHIKGTAKIVTQQPDEEAGEE